MKIKIKILDITSGEFLKGDFSLGVESGEIRGKYGEVFPELKPIFCSVILDKNGIEIYDGAILSFGENYPNYEVVFQNGCFFRKEKNYFIPIFEDEGNLFMQVVGNIYKKK